MKVKLVSTAICGTKGSGKTEFAKHLVGSSGFKRPVWYLIHKDDLSNMSKKIVKVLAKDLSAEELDKVCLTIKLLAVKGEVDAFVIDEADLFIPKNFEALQKRMPNLSDLIINHRHYGLALIFITRRPQSLPTQIFETSDNIIVFAIEGVNIDDYFGQFHEGFKELMPKLSKARHNFIVKSIGDKPKLKAPIKMKGGTK